MQFFSVEHKTLQLFCHFTVWRSGNGLFWSGLDKALTISVWHMSKDLFDPDIFETKFPDSERIFLKWEYDSKYQNGSSGNKILATVENYISQMLLTQPNAYFLSFVFFWIDINSSIVQDAFRYGLGSIYAGREVPVLQAVVDYRKKEIKQ